MFIYLGSYTNTYSEVEMNAMHGTISRFSRAFRILLDIDKLFFLENMKFSLFIHFHFQKEKKMFALNASSVYKLNYFDKINNSKTFALELRFNYLSFH